MEDMIGDLERLGRLRDTGVLTQAEFEAQKARLLGTSGVPAECARCGAPLQLDGIGRCVYCHELQPTGTAASPAASALGSPDAVDDEIARTHAKNKIEAIKVLRQQTGLSLKEAKDRIDAAWRRLGL